MLQFEAFKLLDQPTSPARLRAMARQIMTASDHDWNWYQELVAATARLDPEDLDRLRSVAAEPHHPRISASPSFP